MSSSLSFNPNSHHLNKNILLTNGSSNTTSNTLPTPGTSMQNGQKNTNSKSNKLIADYKQIILELRAQNFDVIRFATYRTASKLRFIQKKLNLHLIDLWNVIETFRDNNLHQLDLLYEIESSKLESCIQNMYIELNKRLAFNQHINVDSQTQLLTAWLLNLYDKNRLSRIKVISFKVALTTMCAGKLTDKIKFIFNQISDLNKNCLVIQKFELYLRELLTLPTSVFEEPSFGYNENLSKTCFDLNSPIRLNDFLNVVLSDSGPACFIWLNVFHRFTLVQSVTHPVTCNVCQRTNFNGFRYKCQKCRKYQLCQDCFWRGRISHSHQLTHQMKEYTNYKSAAKQFSNSLKKSFFCKPSKQAQQRQQQQQMEQYNQQLNYLKQSTYDKRITQSSVAAKMNNNLENISDYSMLVRQQQQNDLTDNIYGTQAQQQQHSPIKLRRIPQKLGAINDYFDDQTNLNKKMQKSVDLITPLQETYPSNQILNRDQLQSTLKKSSTQPYSNTLSMTRNVKPPAANDSNILANFLLAKTSNSSNNLITQDEHSIIANYSSLLSEYYQKNPHLSSSPTTHSTPPSQLKSPNNKIQNRQSASNDYSLSNNLASKANKTKSFIINENQSVYYNMFDSSSSSVNQTKTNKTASLSRHLLPSSNASYSDYQNNSKVNKLNTYYNTNSSYSTTAKQLTLPANTTRSLSESNFRLNNNILHTQITSNEEINDQQINEDKLLKEKREIVAKLEQQNKEIIKEIKRLKLQQLSNRSLDLSEQQKKLLLKNLKDNTTQIKKQPEPEQNQFSSSSTMINPYIIAELQTLKQRKGQLENRMHLLESSRDELVGQLTQLDSVLKQNKTVTNKQRISTNSLRSPNHSPVINQKQKYATLTQNQQQKTQDDNINSLQSMSLNNIVPSTTQTFIPIVSASMAMQMPPVQQQHQQHQQRSGIITNSSRRTNVQPRSWSTPNTPALYEIHTSRLNTQHQPQQLQQQIVLNKTSSSLPHSSSSLLSLAALSNTNSCSVSSNTSGFIANNQNNSNNASRNLRNDLLIAADSVTNAMQSLVKELNSENEMSFNTSSDDDQEDENNHQQQSDLNVYPTNERYLMIQNTNTPVNGVTFRRDLNNDLKQQLLLINSRNAIDYNQQQQNGDTNDDYEPQLNKNDYEDDENCLLTESFIDDLGNSTNYDQNLIDIANNNKSLQLQQHQLQIQFQQQQLQNQLIANLTSNNNEQVASWRRELEQRLIDDNDNVSNDNQSKVEQYDDEDDKKQ